MKTLFLIAGLWLLNPQSAQAQEPWVTIHRQPGVIIQIDTLEVLRGPNGVALVNILTIYMQPQESESGKFYKYALTRVEYDCAQERTWLHVLFRGINRETVEQLRYDNPSPLPFLPATTLGGKTEREVCGFLRLRGRT